MKKPLLICLPALLAATQALAQASAPAAAPASVQKLSSGVVVEHLAKGQGAQPKASDTVEVHYRGTLADGTEFDSSLKRGQPATFPLNRVIPCWTEGLQQLQVGAKARLTCPPDTAYGARGFPPVIPPNSTLTFEVQLLAVKAR